MLLREFSSVDIGKIENNKIEIPQDTDVVLVIGESGTGKSLLLSNLYNHICIASKKNDSVDGLVYPYDNESSYIVRKTPRSSGFVPNSAIWGSFHSKYTNGAEVSTLVGDHGIKDKSGAKVEVNVVNEQPTNDTFSVFIPSKRESKSCWEGDFHKNREESQKRDIYDIEKFLNELYYKVVLGSANEFEREIFDLSCKVISEIVDGIQGFHGYKLSNYQNINNVRDNDSNNKKDTFGFIIFGKGNYLLDELSSGEQSAILMFVNILMEIYKFNHLNGFEPMNGIVLIDEIDLYLHTSLQKKCVKLMKFFPNVQFFISTHSPVFIASVSEAYSENKPVYIKLPNCELTDHISKEFLEFKAIRNNIHINESALRIIEQISNVEVSLLVEGKTDVLILNKAIEAHSAKVPELILSSDGAEILRTTVIEAIKINSNCRFIALFDFDDAFNQWNSIIKGNKKISRKIDDFTYVINNAILVMLLHPPVFRVGYASLQFKDRSRLSIEMMFDDDVLKREKHYMDYTYPGVSEKASSFKGSKDSFANKVSDFSNVDFEGFEKTVDLINKFINREI
ncbi:TPA: AAA family ATPase [Photobacterium damselae]